MSVNVLSRTGAVEKGQWCDLATTALDYIFPINNLRANVLIKVTAYSKSGLVTPTVAATLLDVSNGVVKSFSTIDTDRGSTTNYSEVITDIPITTTQIRLNPSTPSYAYVELIDLSPYPPLTAVTYTTSQTIVVSETSSFALLGGGACGTGWQGSSGPGGGGGSGRLVYGTVNAGSWPLVIGAGAIQSGNSNPGGGASTFSGSTANGGSNGGGGGGAGGSGGGWSTQTNGAPGGAGGFNGNTPPSGGAGSGVVANWFGVANAGGVPAGGAGAGGGGIYAGGAGGGGSFNDGLNANGFAGGGGGGAYQGGTGTTSRKGGNGGNGVLYILTQS